MVACLMLLQYQAEYGGSKQPPFVRQLQNPQQLQSLAAGPLNQLLGFGQRRDLNEAEYPIRLHIFLMQHCLA